MDYDNETGFTRRSYGHGLMDGVAGRGLFGKRYPEEYLRGHNDGRLFFHEMMDKTRDRLGMRLYSVVQGD